MSSAEANLEQTEGASLWTDAWRRLAQNRMAVIATIIFGVIFLLCLIGPMLFAQHSGETNDLTNTGCYRQFYFWSVINSVDHKAIFYFHFELIKLIVQILVPIHMTL